MDELDELIKTNQAKTKELASKKEELKSNQSKIRK